jgi:hypothetical protein
LILTRQFQGLSPTPWRQQLLPSPFRKLRK